nr:UDP-N-acetylmuramate dehydrogenase [Halomonas profundi]
MQSVVTKALIYDLKKIVPSGVFVNLSLAKISRWNIGGLADVIVRPQSPEQIRKLREYFYKNNIAHVVIGMTSNLLFSDKGLLVPCIQLGYEMNKINIDSNIVTAQAGAWVPKLAREVQKAKLVGAEHICGVPGTLGGLVYMNGGSQRKGIGSSVSKVVSIDSKGGYVTRNRVDCLFAYRSSIYQCRDEIISEVVLNFEDADSSSLVRKEMLSILSSRKKKFPRKIPNCGSVFKSDPSAYSLYGPPGKIIEDLGLKGYARGGAKISEEHANFITNIEGATSSDVIFLIELIKERAFSELGCQLNAEVKYVDEHGCICAADQIDKNKAKF